MMIHFQRQYFQNVSGDGATIFVRYCVTSYEKLVDIKKGLTGKTDFMKCSKEKAKGSLSCILGITENASAFHIGISLHTKSKATQINSSEYVNILGFLFSINLF
jgi:hypothetical protein